MPDIQNNTNYHNEPLIEQRTITDMIQKQQSQQVKLYVNIGVWARRAGEGCSPPDSGKTIIFRAKAKFFGQKPSAKNEKCIY